MNTASEYIKEQNMRTPTTHARAFSRHTKMIAKILFIAIITTNIYSNTQAATPLDTNTQLQGRNLDNNISNGYEAYYDPALNITWIADTQLISAQANEYSHPSDFIASIIEAVPMIGDHELTSLDFNDGFLPYITWYGAKAWTQQLSIYGYSDWRLPSVKPINGAYFQYTYSEDGSTDIGYNINSTQSELGYMYHTHLKLSSAPNNEQLSTTGQNALIHYPKQPVPGLEGAYLRIEPADFYYEEQFMDEYHLAWIMGFTTGYQDASTKWTQTGIAWAVRDGDVISSVPEPSALLLALFGATTVIFTKSRATKTCRQPSNINQHTKVHHE
jgi:hypothetical protein